MNIEHGAQVGRDDTKVLSHENLQHCNGVIPDGGVIT